MRCNLIFFLVYFSLTSHRTLLTRIGDVLFSAPTVVEIKAQEKRYEFRHVLL